jgi:iron-sulfur cluster assembly protein
MNITLTPTAAEEVRRIVDDQKSEKPMYLRVALHGGGCSGFKPRLDLDHQFNEENDELLEQHGIKLVVDRMSMLYLDGASIEFINEMTGRGFRVQVPNAKSTCGCGSSVSF